MIEFIIIEPTDPNDKKRSYKYPYVSCEILSSDTATILNAFFPPPKKEANKSSTTSPFEDDEKRDSLEKSSEGESSEDGQEKKSASESDEEKQSGTEGESISKEDVVEEHLLKALFSLLAEKSVNLTLAGYFGKILTNLLAKKSDLTLDFIFADDGYYLKALEGHIYSRSIAELILKILTAEVSNTVYIEQKYDVVRRLITVQFNADADFEALANIAYVLGEVISKNAEFGTFITKSRDIIDVLFSGLIGSVRVSIIVAEPRRIQHYSSRAAACSYPYSPSGRLTRQM